ncbi:Cyclic di-GMP phosphodiesterase response regulator RpfG [Methylobacterium hispanicum]|uniref:Cyclic di-GMP phosphodiesterase response regulator RpfG n=1 Tax=Methylobacterium hispanicum TaxID=270350 RepID=A0AAV4ZQR1_9HYPH|nr:HD domain-containing phosphohydrolase [Methylobacterium hispanicum]GJD90874.1 Cyclic di-GMP phosphodiesterase response regulator RpfG [Methylobacterium hispanicum]
MRVVLVDDDRSDLAVMEGMLRGVGACAIATFADAAEALAHIVREPPDLLIVAYGMPGMDGIEFVRRYRDARGSEPHVMMLTTEAARDLRYAAFDAGADEHLVHPLDHREFRVRIANVRKLVAARKALADEKASTSRLVAEHRVQVERGAEELVGRLLRAAERRDDDTGNHIVRMAQTARVIARRLGLDEETVRLIHRASPMHDIGKIGVPDAVLLKPGRLDEAERRIMEGHVLEGYEILRDSAIPLVQVAAEIACSHHERWDGTGYPKGLKGEEIPLSGRIAAVADVFDALASDRPYKQAWPAARAIAYLQENAGRQFDPGCVNAFVEGWGEIAQVYGIVPLEAAA